MTIDNRKILQQLKKAWKNHSPQNPFFPSDQMFKNYVSYDKAALHYEIEKHYKRGSKNKK